MNITRENLSDLDLLIKIEIVESDYAENVQKQLKNYQKRATIPGFRTGKAPMALVQRMYKSSIVATEVENKLSECLYKYIDDEKLDLLGGPLSNDEKTGKIDFENNTDFTFYFDAALMPTFELAWDKVDATLYQVKVSPKDVDKQLENIQQRHGKFETPDTVGAGDYVYGKVEELDKDGNVKEGGVSTFVSFDLSSLKNSEETSAPFIGKKASDTVVFNAGKAFSAADIENHFHLEAADAKKFKSDLRMNITGISHITPHEVNDELFKLVFPNEQVKDIAAFRKLISKDIEKAYAEQADIIYSNTVQQQLFDNFDAPIPEAFLKRWIASRGEKDITAEDVETNWNDKYLPSIKWELIDSALNKVKPLEPTANQITDHIKDILRTNDRLQEGEDEKAQDERLEKAARSIAADRQNVEQVVNRLRSQNSTALFKEKLNPQPEKVSIKEFAEKMK